MTFPKSAAAAVVIAGSLAIGIPGPGDTGIPAIAVAADTPKYDNCGFQYVDDRRITARRNISCAGAKRVLRRLREGRHTNTIPMVCGQPRVVKGWRIANIERVVDVVMNSYTRGHVSFHYHRVQSLTRPFCPAPRPHSEGVG